MGSVLARTLLETDQEIPEFLRNRLPQGITRETVKFETESDFDPAEYEMAGGPGGDFDGFGGDDANAGAPSAWGADADVNESAAGDGGAWGGAAPVDAAGAWGASEQTVAPVAWN